MPARDHIQTQGTVMEILKDGAYRVELANGHRCIARTSGEARLNLVAFTLGEKVSIEFHPYDLSRGRIVG